MSANSDLIRSVSQHMESIGGEAVRFRAVEGGKMQYWVKQPNGEVVAAEKMEDLAARLGVKVNRAARKDSITTDRAAVLSGYSRSIVLKAVQDGELPVLSKGGGHRSSRFSREAVMRWAEQHRAKGPMHAPQGPRKPRLLHKGAVAQAPRILAVADRLTHFLARTAGTPLEVTREAFTKAAINAMLDRLEGKS